MAAKVYHLSNGVPVAIESNPHTQLAAVGMYFDIGARYEDKKNNGAAHFLEHMFFKGTDTRTTEQLSDETEDMGVSADAATGHDQTSYSMTGLATDAEHMIDVLGDMVTKSILPVGELKTERGAILQEIAMDEGNLEDAVTVAVRALAYPGQPYGAEILGTRKNVSTMSRETLKNFMRKHYHAGNLVVSVAGNVDPDKVLAALEKSVGQLPAKPHSAYAPAVFHGGGYRHIKVNSSQFHLKLAFNACAQDSPDYWAARLLGIIMGGGTSSRLFREVRDKRGLVYDVYAANRISADTGTFEIYAATDPDDVGKLVPVLCKEIRKIRDNGVTERELLRAKNQFIVGLAETADSTQGRMETMASQLQLYGRLRSADKIRADINNVTLEQINALASRIFSGTPTLATAGPYRRAASYNSIFNLLSPS